MHAVFDGVGADTWEEDFLVVRTGATIVSFGNASGAVPPFSPLKLSPKCLKVVRPTLFPYIATPEDFGALAKDVSDIVAAGGIKVSSAKDRGSCRFVLNPQLHHVPAELREPREVMLSSAHRLIIVPELTHPSSPSTRSTPSPRTVSARPRLTSRAAAPPASSSSTSTLRASKRASESERMTWLLSA